MFKSVPNTYGSPLGNFAFFVNRTITYFDDAGHYSRNACQPPGDLIGGSLPPSLLPLSSNPFRCACVGHPSSMP
jgi:hypothetical protein